jgi:GT2 family glycosyltransferase
MTSPLSITVAIPTYGRDQVLVDTIRHVLALVPPPAEIIVLDQNKEHIPEVTRTLEEWHRSAAIRWLHLPEPLIPRALNRGLIEARHDIVLFLDDDIIPEPDLVKAHVNAHEQTKASLVAGRVVQPWHQGIDFSRDNEFHFAGVRSAWIEEFMACNFSIARQLALEIGGFDERFIRVAYNFEAEFAYRWRKAGHSIYFEPAAKIDHLRATVGGTRAFGEHLRSVRPNHAVGAYYYILRTWSGRKSTFKFLARPLRAISTRHHLRRPWWIPVTLIAELSGMTWALALAARGPRYIESKSGRTDPQTI